MLSDVDIDRLQIESEAAYKRSRWRVSGQQIAPSDSPDWWFARAVEAAACAARDQRIAELECQLAEARNQALEDAAKCCEQEHHGSGEHPEMALHCAEDIRSMKEQTYPQFNAPAR